MRKIFMFVPTPKSIIANGMRAVAGIARTNSSAGETTRSTIDSWPMTIPTTIAIARPANRVFRLARRLCTPASDVQYSAASATIRSRAGK
jgi:hypothetical protein